MHKCQIQKLGSVVRFFHASKKPASCYFILYTNIISMTR